MREQNISQNLSGDILKDLSYVLSNLLRLKQTGKNSYCFYLKGTLEIAQRYLFAFYINN